MKNAFNRLRSGMETLNLTMLLILNLFFMVFLLLAVCTVLVLAGVDEGFLYHDGQVELGGALAFVYTVCILIAVSMVVMIRMVFIHPLQRNIEAMKKLANGDFAVRVDHAEHGYVPREMVEFEQSFNKAAEESFITPTAVIKQINLLEESLDLQLFVRTHRGLQLTSAGRSLVQDAKYIIQYCKDSVTRAKNAMQAGESVIRIGTSPMTPAQVLVDLWPRLQEDCPGTKFQLVPFDNTPENAREILGNLGKNIDVVAGIFDETMLNLRRCAGLEISREPICCAVSVHHRLAGKDRLTVQDLYGENLMLMRRDWSHYVDMLRDDIWKNHPKIHIVDFDFYDVGAFNQCENNNCILMAIENWRYVHPLLKILPVDWNYTIPFGLLHAREPSPLVRNFLRAVEKATRNRKTVNP